MRWTQSEIMQLTDQPRAAMERSLLAKTIRAGARLRGLPHGNKEQALAALEAHRAEKAKEVSDAP